MGERGRERLGKREGMIGGEGERVGEEMRRFEKTERVIISGRIKATNPDQVKSAHYLFRDRVACIDNKDSLTRLPKTTQLCVATHNFVKK